MDQWIPLESRTLRENVTDLLRTAIIEGSLRPGAELNQAQIADKLGISRGPLREALGQLEQEGLIRSVPYKGVFVTAMTPAYIRELYSLRSALELFALELWIERPNHSDLAHLKKTVEEMRKAAKQNDNKLIGRLDLEFHSYIIQMARHALLERTWLPLKLGVQRCLHARHRIYQSLDEVVGSHPTLIEALEAKDADAAKRVLKEHILEAGEKICQYWPHETAGGLEL